MNPDTPERTPAVKPDGPVGASFSGDLFGEDIPRTLRARTDFIERAQPITNILAPMAAMERELNAMRCAAARYSWLKENMRGGFVFADGRGFAGELTDAMVDMARRLSSPNTDSTDTLREVRCLYPCSSVQSVVKEI